MDVGRGKCIFKAKWSAILKSLGSTDLGRLHQFTNDKLELIF